jgi:hypothetical protein
MSKDTLIQIPVPPSSVSADLLYGGLTILLLSAFVVGIWELIDKRFK